VLRLKQIGLSLVEIRDLLASLLGPGDVRGRLSNLLPRVEEQVAVLEEQRREIERSLEAVAVEVASLRRTLAD